MHMLSYSLSKFSKSRYILLGVEAVSLPSATYWTEGQGRAGHCGWDGASARLFWAVFYDASGADSAASGGGISADG
jgi:hypothetical protein